MDLFGRNEDIIITRFTYHHSLERFIFVVIEGRLWSVMYECCGTGVPKCISLDGETRCASMVGGCNTQGWNSF